MTAIAAGAVSCNAILGNEEGYLVAGEGGASGAAAGDAGSGGVVQTEAGTSGEGGVSGTPSGGSSGAGAPNTAGASGTGCGGESDGVTAGAPCPPVECPSCALPRAEATCVDGACAIARCLGPFRDANQSPSDGCETGDVAFPGLTLWFMADRGVTQTANQVSSWQDQSGNGFHAQQSNAALMPRRVVPAVGLPLLEFDGADDGLQLPAGFAATSGTSFFAVAEALPHDGCAGILSFSNGDDVDDIEFGRHTPNRLYYEVVGQFVEGAPNAFEVNRRFLVDIVQSSRGAVELRINRIRTGAGTINLPASVNRTQNFVGKDVYDECLRSFHGRIGEILYYARGVTNEERDRIGVYLVEKWAITP